jgi:hypothetical protein
MRNITSQVFTMEKHEILLIELLRVLCASMVKNLSGV